jgi:hypothetical protein
MADVNAFIDAIGADVKATVVPRVEHVVQGVGEKILADYVPQAVAFVNQLMKQIVDEQSVVFRDFVATVLQDIFQRYRPELAGELRAAIVQDGIQLTGEGIRLDVKRRDSGAPVASLDLPLSLKIKIDPVVVNVQDTTINLDVIR